MEDEFKKLIVTSVNFASALGTYEGNVHFILENQSRLSKDEILRVLQDTYSKAEKQVSQK